MQKLRSSVEVQQMWQSGEHGEIKDSCPFYNDLDDFQAASTCANLTDVVKGRNVDLQIDKEECFTHYSTSTLTHVFTL